MASVSVGDKVTTTATKDVNGTSLASFVRSNTYDVIQVNGNRVVIGKGKAVTAAVDINTLTVVGGSSPSAPQPTPVVTPTVPVVVEKVRYVEQDAISSQGIEQGIANMIKYNSSDEKELLKYSMRLHGIPHQFTKYCDYRSFSISEEEKTTKVGRKFIENIMLEAPVVTIIPGKPVYLPAAKNKQDKNATMFTMMTNANESLSNLFLNIDSSQSLTEKMRYYDFQQDYLTYMKYVNILCSVAAAYLDLTDAKYKIDGEFLTKYNWKNYRWTSDNYSMATTNIIKSSVSSMTSFINGLKTYGQGIFNYFDKKYSVNNNQITSFDDSDDPDLIEQLEDALTQINFVQFYVDSNTGFSENNNNSTASSKLEGILDSGAELFKELAFLANSGGVDASQYQEFLNKGIDSLNMNLFEKNDGAISGIMSRILSSGSNVIKGDNMIFPKIYQNSEYSKNYSISIDLRCPYGNKLSYFLNILVPLFHLIALAVPKQTTANTYGSPFLIKAFYPGVFSCNLGIVDSITIDKNPNGDSWTVDGFPTNIKVTLNISDLYSDLNITPAGNITLFMSNSSLIEYLATSCGVNLTVPQLKNRVKTFLSTAEQAFGTIEDNVAMEIFGGLENYIASLTGV